jgi:DNA polymerase V
MRRDADDASQPTTGFPSLAQDYAESSLNLHAYVVRHPEATFFWRAQGGGMQGAGIFSGDILVVDRAVEPHQGDVVVAAVAGEYLVRRWYREPEGIMLLAEHPDHPPLLVSAEEPCECWGVVVAVVHDPNRRRA